MPQISRRRGFTLIELLVVIAIIGLLASTILASMSDSRIRARDAQRFQEARQLTIALEMFRNRYGQYPCSGLTAGNVVLTCHYPSAGGVEPVVLKGNSNIYSEMGLALRDELNFKAGIDYVDVGIIYRVSDWLTSPMSPDVSSYTILVYQEARNGWCEINAGRGHSAYVYPSCPISAI